MPGRHDSDWDGVRLHVVTGKGGTGKTTIAAALAVALATGGHRVLLAEVEGRAGIAPLFGVPLAPHAEGHVAVAPGGGEVLALSVEPEAALLEYLELFYRLGRAGRALERLGAIDFVTTVAPGLRDVLLIGKVYEAVRRRVDGRRVYDAVVLDAPPTGRITRFLNVNREVAGLARVGPIHHHASSIMQLLRSPETAVHLVTVLEEMPVQETVDGFGELRAAGLPVGGVVVNLVRDPVLAAAELDAAADGLLDREAVAAGLETAGLGGRRVEDAGPPARVRVQTLADGLLVEAAEHGVRLRLGDRQFRRVEELGRPTYQVPALPCGIDLGALYELAERLRDQGLA